MNNTWFDQFKKQIRRLTDHHLSSIEKKSFSRQENVIVRSLICFTNAFVTEVCKKHSKKRQNFEKKDLERFLENTKLEIAEGFRKAVIPALCPNEDEFSLSQFAVLLNQNIKHYQRSSNLKCLPEYRIVHALTIECGKAGKGLTTVLAGFCFDCDSADEEDWAFFDLKISNEETATKFVRNGQVYADLLNLDSLTGLNFSFVNESVYAET